MRRIKEFVTRKVADEILLVPTGQTAQEYNGLITLSEVGEFIWDNLEKVQNLNEMVTLITDRYDVDSQTASRDSIAFIVRLLKAGLIKPDSPEW